MNGDLSTLFSQGFTSSHDVYPWRGKCLMKSSKSFHIITFHLSPSECSMWQHTENSLCKINSFQHVSHAKFPSAPASGKCGHQQLYEQIHGLVWWVHTFICRHIMYTICNAASASLDVKQSPQLRLTTTLFPLITFCSFQTHLWVMSTAIVYIKFLVYSSMVATVIVLKYYTQTVHAAHCPQILPKPINHIFQL